MPLVFGALWVLATTATAFLPMKQQMIPGLALLITAPVLQSGSVLHTACCGWPLACLRSSRCSANRCAIWHCAPWGVTPDPARNERDLGAGGGVYLADRGQCHRNDAVKKLPLEERL